MNIRTLLATIPVLAAIILAGCGKDYETAPTATLLRGTVSKGLINNGTVRIYAINPDGSKGRLLIETSTDGNGNYSSEITPYTGPVLGEAFGSYTDEATGLPMTIPVTAPLRAANPNARGVVNMAITAITDLAVRQAPTLTAANITAANQTVSDIFKFDIVATQPVAPDATVLFNGTTTQAQRDYTLALATVSQMGNGAPVTATLASLADDIAGNNGFSAATTTSVQSAFTTFLLTNPNNQTGATIASTNLTAVGSKSAVIRLSSSGIPANTISGAELTVSLPLGAAVLADHLKGELFDGALAVSGVTPANALIKGKYTSQPAAVKIAVVSTTPFGSGEFATLTVFVPAGNSFTASDFAVTSLKFVDTNGQTISGVTVTKTLTLQ